jgi:hypothetical protein
MTLRLTIRLAPWLIVAAVGIWPHLPLGKGGSK